jgi:hypothetical protein
MVCEQPLQRGLDVPYRRAFQRFAPEAGLYRVTKPVKDPRSLGGALLERLKEDITLIKDDTVALWRTQLGEPSA